MRAVTRHIEGVPKEWQSTNDWDSHRELLWLALSKTKNKIVEFGSGEGSTPLIRDYSIKNNRDFLSLESNKDWADKMKSTYVEKYDLPTNELGLSLYADLTFIDAAPASIREFLIRINANKSNVIIIHDTEPGADYVYGMKEILSTFKYRLDYQPEGMPHTTAVSNTVNVCTWI